MLSRIRILLSDHVECLPITNAILGACLWGLLIDSRCIDDRGFNFVDRLNPMVPLLNTQFINAGSMYSYIFAVYPSFFLDAFPHNRLLLQINGTVEEQINLYTSISCVWFCHNGPFGIGRSTWYFLVRLIRR